jgi:1-deoxy-D-xylulose-5-phosphate reductoisomerase
MSHSPKRVAILGSTGSIGQNTLEVIAALEGRFEVVGLSAHRRLDLLACQARQFHCRWAVATDAACARQAGWPDKPRGDSACRFLVGHAELESLVAAPDVETVVAAIVGVAGLPSTLAAVGAGKTVALANKETLVAAGELVTGLARRSGAHLVPIDSEHSAVFQAAQAGHPAEIRRVILTASGGPFRDWTLAAMREATIEQTLAHPNWDMGKKVSVDSATMMNKGLEIIEARWLFDLSVEQISVMIHPQSIVHSLVEFVDGSVVAQLSPPDMRLPIQYALTYPERLASVARQPDWSATWSLTLEPPDLDRFPALGLAYEAAARGGTTGAVLNAANEAAVEAFLVERIGLGDIVDACRDVLDHHDFDPNPTIDEILRVDAWARRELDRWIATPHRQPG